MSEYNWIPILEKLIPDNITSTIRVENKPINPYDEIRHMSKYELKAYLRDKSNKAAHQRMKRSIPLRYCSKQDRLIASKMLYARNRLRHG